MTCTHNFTKAFISYTDCITAVATISCKYMKPTTYSHILLCYQRKSMQLIAFSLRVSSKATLEYKYQQKRYMLTILSIYFKIIRKIHSLLCYSLAPTAVTILLFINWKVFKP